MSEHIAPSSYTKRTYGGVSGEERSRQRRERLIEAGLQVFGTLGHDKATMRDICASARLAERYFYENFSNIDDAFEAVHVVLTTQLQARMTEAIAEVANDTPLRKTATGLTAYYQFIQEDPRRAQILLLDAPRLGHNNVRQEGSAMNCFSHFMATVVRQHSRELPHGMDIELVTTGLIGLAVQTGITWYHTGFQAPVAKIVEHNLYAWRGLAQWLDIQAEQPLQGQSALV
jgi:AcrR family transcriptional regulator